MIPDIIKTEKVILQDESLFSGWADSTSAPTTTEELCAVLRYCREMGLPVTVRGSLTAMNGAGVPSGGHSMSMERLNRVDYDPDTQTIWAQAGACFQKIEQTVRRETGGMREFAASPTEKTATIGGALCFATSGIRALGYGTVAQQVLELEYCDNTGAVRTVDQNSEECKLLLGSEGMCAVITGVRLATTPVPGENWGLIFFLDSEDRAAELASSIRNLPGVTALEYLDSDCLTLLRTLGREMDAVARLPELPKEAAAAIYTELEARDDVQMEAFAEEILVQVETVGADPDCSWTAVGAEVERFREFHHALQECINLKTASCHRSDEAVTRLTWPVCAALAKKREKELEAQGLETAVFGHWDDALPLGIHIFARSETQYRRAKEMMARWSREEGENGTVTLPHRGIGKVYADVFSPEELKRRKAAMDPEGLFNPGNSGI